MKSSSFKNILLHKSNEPCAEGNVNDLLMEDQNCFRNWECWAGIQNISIDSNGDVWRAICRQGEKLGSIYSDFDLATSTVICRKERCNCAADIQISKADPKFRNTLRVGRGHNGST